MQQQGNEALATVLPGFTLHHRYRLVQHATATRIPAIYPGKEFAEAGGLMSYGTDRLDQWRRAAFYVDKILTRASSSTGTSQGQDADMPDRFERHMASSPDHFIGPIEN